MTQDIVMALLVNAAVFTVLFGLMSAVRALFSKKISATLQYALWAVVVIKLVIPFGFESSLSPFGIFNASDTSAAVAAQTGGETDATLPGIEYEGTELTDTALHESTSGVQAQSGDAGSSTKQNVGDISTPQAASASQPLGWAVWALMIWGFGAFAVGATQCVCTLSLLRRVRHSELPVPESVMRVFEGCRQEMKINRRIGVRMQSAVKVPFVMGVFRPMVVLPKDIDSRSGEQIRHACLHELTHVKYGDLAVIALLNALSVVYWFNPLIWLCFRIIRKDMEAACDSRVLRRIGSSARIDYIGTVLRFTGRESRRRLQAAMSMADGRLTAEQRIRGMFKKTRTGRKGRAVAVCIAVIMLAMSVMTACQPTPEKPFVQSKESDSVQQAIESSPPGGTAEIHRYSAPETWQSEVVDDAKEIGIDVDAQVIVPTDTWGLYQLIQQESDEVYLEQILHALIGDAEIYGEDTYASRSQLQEQLSGIDTEISMVQQQETNPAQEDADLAQSEGGPQATGEIPSYDKEAVISTLQERRNAILAAIQTAPDETTTVRVDIDTDILFDGTPEATDSYNPPAFGYNAPCISVHSEGSVEIRGLADIGRIEPAHVYLSARNGSLMDIRFQIECGGNGGFGSREPLDGSPLEGVTITQDEAAQVAKQAVLDMGFNYLDVAAVHQIRIYNSTNREETDCYAFTFNRSLDGVPVTYAYWNGGMTDAEWQEYEEQYAVNWETSEALICVNDSGIVLVDINVPYSDVSQLAQGIELKDFGEIMDIFNQQAIIEGCFSPYGDDDRVLYRDIHVDEIRLGYMPTIWKDHPNQIIFMPVWDFFGSETTSYDPDYEGKEHSDLYASLDENYQHTFEMGNQAILTINAIDGTIMQRLVDAG